MFNEFLMEGATVKVIVGPVDLNTAANTGNRVDMAQFDRVTFICVAAAGSTPNSHVYDLDQHTVASSGSPIALSVANPYYHCMDAATSFTKVEPGSAADTYDIDALTVDTKYVVVFEVLAAQLTEGYRWVSINQTDSGGAQLGTIIAICRGAKSAPAYGAIV